MKKKANIKYPSGDFQTEYFSFLKMLQLLIWSNDTGTDVMIFKIFSPKKLAKKWRFDSKQS
jgi:hypothetical protein